MVDRHAVAGMLLVKLLRTRGENGSDCDRMSGGAKTSEEKSCLVRTNISHVNLVSIGEKDMIVSI